MTNTTLYLRLLAHVKPYRRVVGLGIVDGHRRRHRAGPVRVMKPLIEGTFIEKDSGIMRWDTGGHRCAVIVRGLAIYLASYAMGWVGSRVVADL